MKTHLHALVTGLVVVVLNLPLFATDAPDFTADAYLWLDASASATICTNANGSVTNWTSRNAAGVAATAYTLSANTPAAPTLSIYHLPTTNSHLPSTNYQLPSTNYQLVSFGSTTFNRDLRFPKTSDIRAVFMVAKIEQSANAFLLGDNSAYDFHRGGSGQFWHTGHSSVNIRNGTTSFNGVQVADPTATAMPSRFGLIDVQTAGGVTASQLCYDRTGGDPRRGGKDIAEVLIFTNVLTAAEQQSVRDYLMSKWNLFGVGGAEVVRAHPRLTAGLERESLIGISLTDGPEGALTNLTVRFDLTNCTPDQITDVRIWRQKYDPVPFAFFERDAVDLTANGLVGTRDESQETGVLAVSFSSPSPSPFAFIYPRASGRSEGDYLWVTAKIAEDIATNAEIWTSIAGDRVQLTTGDFRLENQVARAPHRPFPYKYQIGAYVRQDRLVDNGSTTSDIFSSNPKERFENLTDVLPIYSAKDSYANGQFRIGNWDSSQNDTASTRRLVRLRDQYHPACMIRPSLTPSSWVSANGIYGLAFEVAGASEATRRQFADSIVRFLGEQQCDGLDIDYEWVRDGTNHREWQNIGKMLRELAEQFFDRGYVLSFAGRSHDSTNSGMPYDTADYGAFHVSDYMMMQSYGGGYLNSAPCIHRRTLDVCTKRGLPVRRVVMGQAAYVSDDGHPGWDGASYKVQAFTNDPLRRYDLDTWWKTPYSAYWPFEGMSSLQAQCLWARRENLGGVMSWGYYTDPTWDGWNSFGRHQSKALWPMPWEWRAPYANSSSERQLLLRTESDWFWLADHPDAHVRLANDIVLAHDPLVIDSFTGVIDGDGHTLTLTNDTWVISEKATGLIRTLKGTVKNLTVKVDGRVFTVAARWNDQSQPPDSVRLVNTTSGENPVGVIAAEAGDGAVIENVTVVMDAGSELKGVQTAGVLVGKVTGAAVVTNNVVEVGGKVHLEVRNIWDTLFQPKSPAAVGGAVGTVASAGATVGSNDVTIVGSGSIQDLDAIPAPKGEIKGDWLAPTGFDGASAVDIDIRSSEYAVEAVLELPNYTEATLAAGQYPQLVNLLGASKSVSLSASGDGGGELFLTGVGSTASYAHPISRTAIRGNGDVGSGVKLTPTNRVVTLVVENRAGELRVLQNGETVLVTDKNVASDGFVNSIQIGSGLAQFGGGRILSVRVKYGRSSPIIHPEGYGRLIFDDEFDGSEIDGRNWGKVPDTARHIDWKKYTSPRDDLYAVSNGCLVLTGAKNDNKDPADTRKFQCGQIESNGKFSFKYGVVEIRAKFSNQDGAWPAMWMMPQNSVHGGWPESGEIDITERLNADAKVYETAHFGPQGTDRTSGTTAAINNGVFNIYRLEWTESKLTWFVNGVETHSYSDTGAGHLAWPFDAEFYFILSQQLEGSWVGTVDDETTLPARMFVDYVRVWQKDEENPENNAYLWLTADEKVKKEKVERRGEGGEEDEVVEWQSPNLFGRVAKKYALDAETPAGPTLTNYQLPTTNYQLVSFGSTVDNRDLAFDRATNIRTVFMVAKTEQSGNAFLLGDATAYNFHRGENGEYWSGNASENIRNGQTFWNGERVASPTTTRMPAEFGLVEVHASGDVTASQLCYDRVGNGSVPRRGGKDIAELVIFTAPLDYTARLKLRKRLMEKWLPDLAHPNWSITDDWVLRRENDFSSGLTVGAAFADGAGTYEFKNLKLTGGLQSSGYALRVQEGDAIVLDGTDNLNGRCRFAFDVRGGSVTFPQGAATWYESPNYRQTGGTFTSLANGADQSGTASGFMLGYNGVEMTLDITGGRFAVPDSSINFNSPVTLNVSGAGTVRAKGVFRSGSGASTVNVGVGGRLELGSLGFKANACTLNLNGGTLACFEDAACHNAINVAADSTLEIPSGRVLSIDGVISGAGRLSLAGAGTLKLTVAVTSEEVRTSASKATFRVADGFPLDRCEIYYDCAEYFAQPQKAENCQIVDGVLYVKPVMPDLRASAYLWLDASQTNTMTFAGGEITEWRSVNGGATAVKYTLTGSYASVTPAGPTLTDYQLPSTNYHLVSFGSTTANRDLSFAKSSKVRTVFMVAKLAQNGNAFVLGDSTAFDFHRGTNGEYWHPSHGKLKDGKTYWNGAQVASPTAEKIPNELGLITVETAGDLTASQLCYDRTGNDTPARRGGKDIAELLIFEKTLTTEERRSIESYLMAKWNLNDTQTLLVTGTPAVYAPSTTNLTVYGSTPSASGTFAVVNTTVGAADVTLAERPPVAKLDLLFTMKTHLTLPGGGTSSFTVPSGSSVTIGAGGWQGAITAADATSALRYTGDEPIVWPFAEKGATFAGTVSLACPLSNDGRQYLYGDKTVVFDAGSSMTLDGLVLGNENNVTQTLTIRGGDITVTGAVEPLSTSGSILFAHWPSRVNLTLEAGSFTALNAPTMLGWDGHANLVVAGGRMSLKGLFANRASANDNTSSVVLSGGELSVGADGVDFTGRADRNASFTLAGGTLSCREDAEVKIGQADGLRVTAASTLAAASNTTLSVLAPLTGSGDLRLDAPDGTIAFSDISGWTGALTVVDGTRLYIEVRQSAAAIAARAPVEVVRLPANVTAEQCTVRIVNADTRHMAAATVEIKDGTLVARAAIQGRHLTYTPKSEMGVFTWDATPGAFDGETFSDFDHVAFIRVMTNDVVCATCVGLPDDVWAGDVTLGGDVWFKEETLHAKTVTAENTHFGIDSLEADAVVIGTNVLIRADGEWTAAMTVPADATVLAVDDATLTLGGTNVTFAEGVTFDLSGYEVRTSGRHYIVRGDAADWPTSSAMRVIGDLPLYKDDAGYFTEKIVTVVVTDGEEYVVSDEVYDNLIVNAGGTLVYRGTKLTVVGAVTFDENATLNLFNADGSKIPYAGGVTFDVAKAASFAGLPKSTQDFTFAVVDNGDGTKTLRATRSLGSARVVRAHPFLTRGVGRESLAAIDFSGTYGGNLPSLTFRIRFENMTADDLGDIKLYKMPYGTPYAFYAPSATDLTANFTLTRTESEDGRELTLTYAPTGSEVWICPEVGNREYSDRVWLTGVLQHLDGADGVRALPDDARFYVDVMNEKLSLGGNVFKVENGLASAPHRLYPWRYLVTAYMRRDRINGNTIGTLQNAPEMRWPSLTHVIVSSFNVQYSEGNDVLSISWDDNAAGAFRRLRDYRDKYHSACRLVPSLTKGSYVSLDSRLTGSAESRFAIAHAGEKKYRAMFVRSLVAKMEEMGADGLDIDWEYPDDNGLDFNAYGLLMRDLAEAFFDRGWDLSMCSNLGYRMPGGEVMAGADYMSSMAYGANRGLHAMNTTMSTAISVLTSRNVPARRIVVGQAIYSTAKWHMGWDELAGRCGNDDDIINEAWSYNGSSGNFIGFTGPNTYRAKANRVKGVYSDGVEYGGIMSWGYYTDTGWYGGKSLGWNQRQVVWPRPYNFAEPEREEVENAGGGGEWWYVLKSENDWHWFAENAGSVSRLRLGADITFDHDPKPIPAFSGVFDGAGHKLTIPSGVWIVAFDKVGLFQTLNGTVRNLTLDIAGRFIGRNDRRNDVQSGWTLSAWGGPSASAAVVAAEANAGARIENVNVLMRKGSELRGNHEVGVLAGQVYTAGAGIVISNCTVDCAGTVTTKAVNSLNAQITSTSYNDNGNGRVGLLAGTVNFSGTSEGVRLVDCSATLRASGALAAITGINRSLGGLVGNMHVGANDAKMLWRGLYMTYYEGATVSGPANTSNYPCRCQPFFGYWMGSSSSAKPTLDAASALYSCGARPSGFDATTWLDGVWSFVGATDSGTAPEVLSGAVVTSVDNLGAMTLSALVDLPTGASGDVLLADCTGGYQLWANVSPVAERALLSLTLGYTQNGKRTSCGEVARLSPGTHELSLALTQTSGTTLYVDGNVAVTQAGYKFSSNPFVSACFGFAGVGLFAHDVAPGAACQVRYPKKASYEAVNLIAFGQDDDPLTVRDITYPTSVDAATVKAIFEMPETFVAGPVASWNVAKDSSAWVVEAYRENETSTKVAWRNDGESTRTYAAQNNNPRDNTGTKVLNFTYNNASGSDVALNAQYAASSSATKWGGSKVTGVKLGLKSGMLLGERSLNLGASVGPDSAHPLCGLAEEPAWYPSASSAVRDYFRDVVVSTLGAYEPPEVTVNGKAVTGGESAKAIYVFGGDKYVADDYVLALDAPVVANGLVGLTLGGNDPINAALRLKAAERPSGPWQTAAEIAAGTLERTFVFATSDDTGFYKLEAADTPLPQPAAGMPVTLNGDARVNLGSLTITAEDLERGTLEVRLTGAAVAEGLAAALQVGPTALAAKTDDEGKLVFDLSPAAASLAPLVSCPLTLFTSSTTTNGDLRVASPAVTGLAYSPAALTEVVADNLYGDGFTTYSFGSYRIPSLVSDGAGEVICCYDVRYGGGDLGTGDGIDIGETCSTDGGRTFVKPRRAVDVPNTRDEKGVSHGYAKTNDLGDVAMLYDPATRTYWMMGMTGTGLYQGNYAMNDVVMYTRTKDEGVWKPWHNPASDSTDPMEYRSIKETIMSQPGIRNSTGGNGYGFLQGPGHGFVTTIGKEGVMPKGALVFPTQYFVDSSLTASTVGAIYSTDHGTNWIATARSTGGTNPQENCVMELDDGSWYMTTKAGSRPGTGRINFFRTTNYTNWFYVGEHYPVPCQQGSCLRLGRNKTDGKGRYVLCHTLHPDTATRAQVALVFGSDTTAAGDTAGIAWDFEHPLMLYYENTGFKGYNSLAMVDGSTLGVLYETQNKIYFVRIDVTARLR